MTRRVALFRGLNVGGHNRIAMKDLRESFEAQGCTDVTSVIQSGNICFDSDEPDDVISAAVRLAVADRFAIAAPITLRTGPEITAALDAHPFLAGNIEPKLHHIMFLADPAPHDAGDRIGDHSPGAEYVVIDREIHIRYPRGSARSKLTVALVDRRLPSVATARNLPTCEKIAEELNGSSVR